MTVRAILIGVLGAVLMGAWGQYVNKYIPGVKGLVRGHLPISVFGAMIFFVLVLNPLLGRLRASWRFRAAEVALILGLALVGCGIADAGLMRHFPRVLIHPIEQNQKHPGWQKTGVLAETPGVLLANDGRYNDRLVQDYVTAMGDEGRPISIRQVPWAAWWKPMTVWSALIVLALLGVISLSVLVHRQWAEKERIRYPLAEMTGTLLEEDEQGRGIIVRNRLFWIGMAIPLFIHLVNGIQLWFPKSIAIPMQLDFSALGTKFPEFMKTPGAGYMKTLTIYPACIGFTFLLASEIGFSLGISNLLAVTSLFAMISLGVNVSGSEMTGGVVLWESFGAFLAMGAMLLYIGRRTYWLTLREAVTFVPQPETERAGVWACRSFLLCSAGAVAILVAVGMEWPIAVLCIGLILLLFLICARLNAECGTFFFAPGWQVPAVIVGLFGLPALGPRQLIILGLVMYVLTIDPFECLMPYVVNGLKITTDTKLRAGRVGLAMAGALLAALAVAIPTSLWADYNHAANMERGWDSTNIYNAAEKVVTQLSLAGELDAVKAYGTWGRLRHMKPEKAFLVATGVGFGLLLLISALRLRFTWWPLHPVAVLVFGSWAIGKFAFSFFLGWLLKVGLTRFGGPAKYERFKPMLVGVIVGDLTGAFLIMLTSWLYYSVKGVAGLEWLYW